MRILATAAAALIGAAALGGCGDSGGEGGLTAEESKELDNAAEMLDVPPDSLVADENAPLGNGEMPAETGELPVVTDEATNAGVNGQ
ncbi:MAG: hypothetical protein ACK40O_01870 [Allosphingosinicella sp.]